MAIIQLCINKCINNLKCRMGDKDKVIYGLNKDLETDLTSEICCVSLRCMCVF